MKGLVIAFAVVVFLLVPALPICADGGFDALGWNNTRIFFVGKADGMDGSLDGTWFGAPRVCQRPCGLAMVQGVDGCAQ